MKTILNEMDRAGEVAWALLEEDDDHYCVASRGTVDGIFVGHIILAGDKGREAFSRMMFGQPDVLVITYPDADMTNLAGEEVADG